MSKKVSQFLAWGFSAIAPLLILNADSAIAQNSVQKAISEAKSLSEERCQSSEDSCSDCAQEEVAPSIIEKYRITNPRVVRQVYGAAMEACS